MELLEGGKDRRPAVVLHEGIDQLPVLALQIGADDTDLDVL